MRAPSKNAQNFIDLASKDAGYEDVDMDDYWGDPNCHDSNGQTRADLTKFPDGIEGLVKKIHALDLKAGIYSSASMQQRLHVWESLGFDTSCKELVID
ncbi:hypothetical protein LTR56_014679 [Elasticomyces elasticus]|nr:hypothetical protein LTR56_014679 [Elasticomyces elasticus]KAK3636798.1 hypothetical protein LTR22_018551 [Elasticomyces elasticus]KAK4912502.1 hypothetical protein LTR49_019046 [Elasticomyces elasticus]KAK5751868.1 hypothetical protein LTS12_018046 [Elasticomyces elasticus]